ncbi:MAG: hypothetical protein OQK24_11790 [Magnetovibrio sp.]|nr:hypothetical protein [Magnetovibrio sp.]
MSNSMQRSQTQIATTYAPNRHFTFEGGAGACISVPIPSPDTEIKPSEQSQIIEGMKEFVENWSYRGMSCRPEPQVEISQTLDESVFLDHLKHPTIDISKFEFTKPDKMGFRPDPLVFICRNCGLVHEVNLEGAADPSSGFANTASCSSPSGHEWSQLDVVFTHWSGEVKPLSPYQYDVTKDGKIYQRTEGKCAIGGKCKIHLHRGRSGRFRDWQFRCSTCGEQRDLVQRDTKSLEWLYERYSADPGAVKREVNMLPISYRANSLYYVQSEQIISYNSTEHIDLMAPTKSEELMDLILHLCRYPGGKMSDDELLAALNSSPEAAAQENGKTLDGYINALATPDLPEPAISALNENIRNLHQLAAQKSWINTAPKPPGSLTSKIADRAKYTRKFDPIRLAVEHSVLRKEKIDVPTPPTALHSVVDIRNPDKDLRPKGSEIELKTIQGKIDTALGNLGIEEIKLIRGLDMLQYAFGYSRVSSTPITVQKKLAMPVRLCAFPQVGKGKRPIYVLHQQNEAFYIRLDEARVSEWLENNGLGSEIARPETQSLGSKVIENYVDFGRFVDKYSERSGSEMRNTSSMVYALLHTMAHHFIHVLSKFSGLDIGSLGERVFPADMAFMVFRKGMTPDLGNLAAMWRNHHVSILDELLNPRSLRCGSGTLCDERGGACPGCIMIPEVGCIAGNNLLSRALLVGGKKMAWDSHEADLVGYF